MSFQKHLWITVLGAVGGPLSLLPDSWDKVCLCFFYIKKNLNKIMKFSIVSYLTFLPDWYIHKTKPGGSSPMYYGMTTVTKDPTPKTLCHHFWPGLILHLWIGDTSIGERRTTICQSIWDKSEVLWEHVGEHIPNLKREHSINTLRRTRNNF